MMMRTKSIFLACLVAGLSACYEDPDDSSGLNGNGNGDNGEETSRAYIDAIVPHHEMALMMAEEAIAKAVHPGLKEMARMMMEAQTREIAEFKRIRTALVGSDTTPDPMEMKEMPAGPEFDRMFLHMMIDHHQGAIDQSILALDAGVARPLDSLARQTIEMQRMEQSRMNDSLQAWYGGRHRVGDGAHRADTTHKEPAPPGVGG